MKIKIQGKREILYTKIIEVENNLVEDFLQDVNEQEEILAEIDRDLVLVDAIFDDISEDDNIAKSKREVKDIEIIHVGIVQ